MTNSILLAVDRETWFLLALVQQSHTILSCIYRLPFLYLSDQCDQLALVRIQEVATTALLGATLEMSTSSSSSPELSSLDM